MDNYDYEQENDVILEEEEQVKTQKPKMYKVLLHNDDYTSMEFVIFVLKLVFRKSELQAFKIMMDIHTKGLGVAGIYTYEVASTNAYLVEKLAEENEYPFKATVEEA